MSATSILEVPPRNDPASSEVSRLKRVLLRPAARSRGEVRLDRGAGADASPVVPGSGQPVPAGVPPAPRPGIGESVRPGRARGRGAGPGAVPPWYAATPARADPAAPDRGRELELLPSLVQRVSLGADGLEARRRALLHGPYLPSPGGCRSRERRGLEIEDQESAGVALPQGSLRERLRPGPGERSGRAAGRADPSLHQHGPFSARSVRPARSAPGTGSRRRNSSPSPSPT